MSPNPVSESPLVVRNGSNTCGNPSGRMPLPVSCTSICTRVPADASLAPRSFGAASTRASIRDEGIMIIPPRGIASRAFKTRFSHTGSSCSCAKGTHALSCRSSMQVATPFAGRSYRAILCSPLIAALLASRIRSSSSPLLRSVAEHSARASHH